MTPDMLNSLSQPTPSVNLVTTTHMTVLVDPTSQPGQSLVSVEDPIHIGPEENETNNDGVSTPLESANECQDMDTKLIKSEKMDETAKETISLAWRYYNKQHHNGKKPFTSQKWLLPWQMCRSWTELIETTKQILVAYPYLIEEIEDKHFEIERSDGMTIVPQFWELLAEPNHHYYINFRASKLVENSEPFYKPLYHSSSSSSISSTKVTGVARKRGAKASKSKTSRPKFQEPGAPLSSRPAPPLFTPSLPLSISSGRQIVAHAGKPSPGESLELVKKPKEVDQILIIYDYEFKYTVEYWKDQGPYGGRMKLGTKSFKEPIRFSESEGMEGKKPVLEETIELFRQQNQQNIVPPPPPHLNYPANSFLGLDFESNESHPTMYPGDQIRKRTLTIHSILLLNAIRAIVEHSAEAPAGDSGGLKDGVFPFPYRDLYHHKEELLKYKISHHARSRHSENYNTETDRHIDVLIKFLYSVKEVQLKEAEERWVMKEPLTTFSSFWLLLKPGTDVYVRENGCYNAYVIERSSGGTSNREYTQPYEVIAWNLRYDGHRISRRYQIVVIPVFDGEREIRCLPLFPVEFYKNTAGNQTLKEQLIIRGKDYMELSKGPAFREYSGKGLESVTRDYERARVVVVYKNKRHGGYSYSSLPPPRVSSRFDTNNGDGDEGGTVLPPLPPPPPLGTTTKSGPRTRIPSCECTDCKAYNTEHPMQVSLAFSDYDDINPVTSPSLKDHIYFLCNSNLWAFILKDRVYDRLDVSGICEPKINSHAIDRLVMKSESIKALIKAVCQSYSSVDHQMKGFSADFFEGKGEGHIFLLHGPPGTGKTLTAESVAEFTRRPLLSITAADLGHDAVNLERNLLTFFRNANEWGAIVLLDEADIYMERRSNNDLSRNSVVSVFLRALDYFKGILFLTTNRVGQFDEAFMSRIHLQIGYDALDEYTRENIWNNTFQKLRDDHKNGGADISYEWEAKEYAQKSAEVRQLQWNGREIRNAFQTAVDLALYDAKGKDNAIVKESHLKKVVQMSQSFKDYMKATHENLDDSEMAYRDGLRDDQKKHNDIVAQ